MVLHVRNFGEAHRIVELCTAEDGRIAAVARHARSSRRRFAGALDLFVHASVRVSGGSGLWTLHEAAPLSARVGIRTDLARFARASRLVEAVRLLVPEHHRAPEVFAGLTAALDALDRGELEAACDFYPRLLAAQGILPDLAACVGCGRHGVTQLRLDAARGGALCDHCSPGGRALPRAVISGLGGVTCPDAATAAELEECAVAWIEGHTGRPLRSRVDLLT